MTKHPNLDLSGMNLYNENGGVVQGQICGQAFMTKLLRKKGNKGTKELSLAFQKDASALCMSPVGRPKKIKFHKHNLYENMNNMSSIDTESCTSDDIFSDASGAGVNATIDDLEAPAFVAQFDPMQLVSQSNSPEQHVQQQKQSGQSHVPPGAGAGPTRRAGVPWSASLPAVAEEDSQSEQSSHLGIWRNGQGLQSPEKENVGVISIMGHKEQVLKQQGDPNATMDLLESDRIVSPRAIPIALASPPAIPHSRPLDERDNESQSDSKQSTPSSTPKKQPRDPKRSKDESMREAVDRRIRQAMEDAMQNAQSEDASDVRRLESIDSGLISADSYRRSPTHNNANCDPFIHHGSSNQMGRYNQRQAESFLPKGYQQAGNEVSSAMQELLLQQQMTLKEMSMQNSHYRQELHECQEIFGKWRLEREKQRSTIQDLVKEKEAYATEAGFLRNEMSSIRQELEALRKETTTQAANMQSPQPPHPQRHQQKQSPYHEMTPNQFQGFRHKQPQEESPSMNGSPPILSSPQFHPDYRQSPPPESLSEDAGSPLGINFSVFANSPPPPPPDQRASKRNSSKPEMSSPSPNRNRKYQPNYASPSPNKKEKPLLSGLKQPNTDSTKKKRSVKFHDPPMSKQWTLFPNQLHDDCLLEQSYQDSKQTETRDEVESQQELPSRGEETLNVQVPEVEPQDSVDDPTPIAANGRAASGGTKTNGPASSVTTNSNPATETAEIPSAAYKYRLETMKKEPATAYRKTRRYPCPRRQSSWSCKSRKEEKRQKPYSQRRASLMTIFLAAKYYRYLTLYILKGRGSVRLTTTNCTPSPPHIGDTPKHSFIHHNDY